MSSERPKTDPAHPAPEEVHGTASFDTVRLVLTIQAKHQSGRVETTRYRVYGVKAEAGVTAVRLVKFDGSIYDLERREYGWECSCQDFHGRRQRHGQLCKHLLAVLKGNVLDRLPAAGDAYEG